MGMGLVMTPATAAAYVHLRHQDAAQASAVTTAVRQVGGSVGTALLAVTLAAHRSPHGAIDGFDAASWLALFLTGAVLAPALFLARATPTSESERRSPADKQHQAQPAQGTPHARRTGGRR